MEPRPQNDWKREPLVWMLIAIPASAVVMGAVMIALAIGSYSGLVVDDYYRQGKQINLVLERDRLAWELGLAATLRLGADDRIEVVFDQAPPRVSAEPIELVLSHATRPGLDRRVAMEGYKEDRLHARLRLPGEGRWNLSLQTRHWRLTGSLRHPGGRVAPLSSNYRPG